MSQSDPVADFLSVIRNGLRNRFPSCSVPTSKLKVAIAEVLKKEGFIAGYEILDTVPRKTLRVELKYGPNGEQVISQIRRVSKPGRRVYRPVPDVKPVLRGLGISILSTTSGVISDREARATRIGGEVICDVW